MADCAVWLGFEIRDKVKINHELDHHHRNVRSKPYKINDTLQGGDPEFLNRGAKSAIENSKPGVGLV